MNYDRDLSIERASRITLYPKNLALLRYREIPYRLILEGLFTGSVDVLPKPKVELLPTFYFPDEHGQLEAVVDSTPIIRQLETLYPDRSVLPASPLVRFLDYLLEDYADEWLTKAMFHYRWRYKADIDKAGAILPRWKSLTATDEELIPITESVKKRQISRLHVVGSNDVTAVVIEESYKRFLRLMSAHMNQSPFIFGQRPSASDFALYGQLSQLAMFDPTPMAVAEELATRVVAWVGIVDDLSGLEPCDTDWVGSDALPSSLKEIFSEVGRVHVPALLANARSISEGDKQVETEIDGRLWVQKPFPYQAKCLQWIRQEFTRLDQPERSRLLKFLDGTGCEMLIQDDALR